jgi:deoxycytidylate deaminase
MITSKDLRHQKQARNLLKFSMHSKYKMVAVLVKGPNTLSCGINKEFSAPKKFVKKTHPKMNLHAEVDCLCGVPRETAAGKTLYIVGQTKAGSPMLTKPCSSCYALILNMRIKRVVFETKAGELEEMKL